MRLAVRCSIGNPKRQHGRIHPRVNVTLEQAGLLDSLVFQGGTSLRLCYGGNRFSEDLDFAGGYDFSSSQLAEMKACIETYFRRI